MAGETPPIVLTVAGSDPSGGAGIQADLKTFAAHGVYGAAVITALTAQNTLGVSGILPVPPDFIAKQFRAVTADLKVNAVKTGMLGNAATVDTIADLLAEVSSVPVVVDPVMVATSGDVLLPMDAIDAVRRRLIPRATLLTPNIPEAARLLNRRPARTETEMMEQAQDLRSLGCIAVLLKGGHGSGSEVVDVLVSGASSLALRHARIETRNTHGTGCTLSAAVAAQLAAGIDLEAAVEKASSFVWSAMGSAQEWKMGGGHGPLDHEFAQRK